MFNFSVVSTRVLLASIILAGFCFANSTKNDTVVISDSLKKSLDKLPLGDQVHVAVFDFIIRELEMAKRISRKDLAKIASNEITALESTGTEYALKPLEADISETQFSHILLRLCQSEKQCRAIKLYQKNGLAIGLAYKNNMKFDTTVSAATLVEKAPLRSLGIRKLIMEENQNLLEAFGAIYRTKNTIAITFEPKTIPTKQLIGFVKYIFVE